MASIAARRDIKSMGKRAADEAPQPQQHAKKPKKSMSVAGLFAKKPRSEREHVVSSDGITGKDLGAEQILTNRAKRHPIYLDVKGTSRHVQVRATSWPRRTEATANYSRGEAGSTTEQLDAIHDDLVARIDGTDIHGKSLDIPGLPSDAELQQIQNEDNLFGPLEEDIITISVTKSDGTVTLKHVKLGDSVQKLEKLIEDSKGKLTRLAKELGEVNVEIDATLNGYNKATKAVEVAYQEKVKKFNADVQSFHKWTIDEIIKARKEDKAHSVEANRKLQEFSASLFPCWGCE
jgi:hypothetical protein